MGRDALLESLRTAAAADGAAIARDAETAASQYQADLDRSFDAERTRLQHELDALTQALTSAADAESERRRRVAAANAALALADRCRSCASQALPQLRAEYGPALFRALAAELPGLEWRHVTVNPADIELAHQVFPGAVVAGDANVSGGMNVATGDGRIRVSNTLETRLALAWPDLAPTLVHPAEPDSSDGTIAA